MMYVNRERIELRDHRVGFVLAIWSIYTLVLGFLSPIVSNSCHLGGLLGGLILGALLPPAILTDRAELARRPTSRLQSTFALAALIASAVFFVPCLRRIGSCRNPRISSTRSFMLHCDADRVFISTLERCIQRLAQR